MKTRLTTLLLVVLSSASFAQTWLEKANNGLDYGTGQPPSTITVNPYSEPFDTSWRDGWVGIGTPEWPKTRLQVHSNDDINTVLDNFFMNVTGTSNYAPFSAVISSGGTPDANTLAGSTLNYTYRSNSEGSINFGSMSVAEGDYVDQNTGGQGQASGNYTFQLVGIAGVGEGENNTYCIGTRGAAKGEGSTIGNFGVWGQCQTQDANSVNVGVMGRGVNGSNGEPALVNIGVHGRAECSGGGGGGTKFNCGVYGTNGNCTDSTGTGGPYPTGSFAGYFGGNVLVTGNVWALSDERLKENIKPIERITDRLGKVKTYSYNFKQGTGLALPNGSIEYGVLAQQLETVFPELVQSVNVIKQKEDSYRDIETVKSVEYGGFIPLLIQANNELNEKLQSLDPEKIAASLAALKEKIAALEKNLESAAVGQNKDLDSYLNAYPNPTTSEMTIDVKRLNCNNCVLMITDLSGKLVRQYEIRSTEEKFRLSANDFQSGVYQCNLIADGKVASGIKIAFTKN
jgi:hypothetical protein